MILEISNLNACENPGYLAVSTRLSSLRFVEIKKQEFAEGFTWIQN